MESHLAHNQEVVGSIPASATNNKRSSTMSMTQEVKRKRWTKWTRNEMDTLKYHLEEGKGLNYIAGKLQRTQAAVYNRAYLMGLQDNLAYPKRGKIKRNRWTDEDEAIVEEMLIAGSSHREIGKELGRTKRAVAKFIYTRGINKRVDSPQRSIAERKKPAPRLAEARLSEEVIAELTPPPTRRPRAKDYYEIRINKAFCQKLAFAGVAAIAYLAGKVI